MDPASEDEPCIDIPTQRHAVENDDNGNMVRNQEPQAPPQQTPLVAATQPIVDQEALNGQLEDVGANDDNNDRDSDNNNEDKDNNAMNWLDHWSLRPEVQEALDNELKKFLAWLQQRHPDDFSRHVERAGGGCQDLTPMASHSIIWNRELCVEYLDKRLCVPGNVNILQMNLFTVLCTSSDNPFRVSTSVEALLIAFDKEFSLCANYPKGHGELFCRPGGFEWPT